MYENQPIFKSLIEQGWAIPGKISAIYINEKTKKGIAVINSDKQGPYKIYWHQESGLWTDKKATIAVHPGIIERHYASAI